MNANVVQEPSPNATVVLPATAVATAFSTQGATYDGGPLRLVATGASWVEVTGSDGVVLLRRNLIQGESIGLSGKLPLSVVLGRADLVTVWVRDQSFDTNAFSKENVARFEVK